MTTYEAAATPFPGRQPGLPVWQRRWVRILFFATLAVVLVVEGVLAAPYVAKGAAAVTDSDLRWLGLAVAFELMSMRAFARMRRRMLAAGGLDLPLRRVESLTYTAYAVGASLPGGSAVASGYLFKRLRSWGATLPAAGFTVLTSSVLSVSAFAVLAAGTAAATGRGGFEAVLVVAAIALAAVATVAIWHRARPELTADHVLATAMRGVNRMLRRRPDTGLDGARQLTGQLCDIRPRARDWAFGLGFAELNWLADLACLLACCQAVGASHASLALIMVAYVAGMSVSSVTVTPGGLGIIDAAMIFALTQGGETLVLATAGVLLYRLVSFGLVVGVGWSLWARDVVVLRRVEDDAVSTGPTTAPI